MKKVMKMFGAIVFASTILISCNGGVKEKDLVGKTFDLDTYHRIKFKTSKWVGDSLDTEVGLNIKLKGSEKKLSV